MSGVIGFVRPHLREIRPYIPGKPIAEVRRELGIEGQIVKLASNENRMGTSKLALEAIKAELDKLWLYPEDSVFYLREALAKFHGVPEDWIVIGNGAVEVIYLLAQALLGPGDEAIMGDPSFMIYAIMSQMNEAAAVQIGHPEHRNDLPAFVDAITPRTKIIWVDNPNNPTGTYVPRSQVEDFVAKTAGRAIVVLDEAYQQYVDHPELSDGIEMLKGGAEHVVVLRTFSKIVGLAGVRCGYGIMHPELASIVRSIRIKFSVNALAQAAALAALNDEDHIRNARDMILDGRTYFYGNLERLGLHYLKTQSNFVWIKLGPDSRALTEQLMTEGVIVRPGWIFGQPEWARVTISTEEENAFFFDKLERCLA